MDLKKRTRWGLERGNIDINDRPLIHNADGTISTTLSTSSEIDGKEVLYPMVAAPDEGSFGTSKSKNPRIISGRDAAKLAKKTGKNLGKFRTWQQADQYANALHAIQAKPYANYAKGGMVGPKPTKLPARRVMLDLGKSNMSMNDYAKATPFAAPGR